MESQDAGLPRKFTPECAGSLGGLLPGLLRDLVLSSFDPQENGLGLCGGFLGGCLGMEVEGTLGIWRKELFLNRAGVKVCCGGQPRT